MLYIIGGTVLALIATLPSVGIAHLYLKTKGVPVGPEGTVQTFMDKAPTALKGALISLNFLFGGLLIGGIIFALN